MEEDQVHWPNKRNRPFGRQREPSQRQPRSASSSDADRFFEHLHDEAIELAYRDGYYFAAENLAYDLLSADGLKVAQPEREFYGVRLPLLYCYRHYLELALKDQIDLWSRVSNLKRDDRLDTEHGLMRLWNEVKRHQSRATSNAEKSDETIASVERCLNEFHQYDPTSQSFRYRRGVTGNTHDDQIPETDLCKLIRTMKGLKNFFDVQHDVVEQIEANRND